jgi:hypothetical protein
MPLSCRGPLCLEPCKACCPWCLLMMPLVRDALCLHCIYRTTAQSMAGMGDAGCSCKAGAHLHEKPAFCCAPLHQRPLPLALQRPCLPHCSCCWHHRKPWLFPCYHHPCFVQQMGCWQARVAGCWRSQVHQRAAATGCADRTHEGSKPEEQRSHRFGVLLMDGVGPCCSQLPSKSVSGFLPDVL